jgi:Protein of unknown function (DUF4231)
MTTEPLIQNNDESLTNFTTRSFLACRGLSNHQLLESIAEIKTIDTFYKKALLHRLSSLLDEYTSRANFYSFIYYFGRAIVTIGSLIVPALLSIQGNSTLPYAVQLYWVTWATSLLVTTFNGIMTLFKIEKKYYYLNTIMEQVRSEGWQYVHLTGKYGGHNHPHSTHENELIFFTHSLERIKLGQTNEEFWKSQESSTQTPNKSTDPKSLEGLFVPTPTEAQLLEEAKLNNFDGGILYANKSTPKMEASLNSIPKLDGEKTS